MSKIIQLDRRIVMAPAVLRRRYIELQSETHCGIKGEIRSIQIIRKDGSVRQKLGPYPNLITDAGLNAIGAHGSTTKLGGLFNHLGVGTGNTAPANDQTTLVAQVGARSSSNGGFSDVTVSGPAYAYWECERTREFAPDTVDGVALAELGYFNASSAGIMVMRQLIRDDVGAPTTITLDAEEILRIIYAWRLYPQIVLTESIIDVAGVSTTIQSRAQRIDEDFMWGNIGLLQNLGMWHATGDNSHMWYETNVLPATTAELSGTVASPSTGQHSFAAYVTGNFYRDMTVTAIPSLANFASGIGGVAMLCPRSSDTTSNQPFATVFSPKIAKTNVKQFVYTGRISWGRYV